MLQGYFPLSNKIMNLTANAEKKLEAQKAEPVSLTCQEQL